MNLQSVGRLREKFRRIPRPVLCTCIAAVGVVVGAIVGRYGEGLRPAAPTQLSTIGRLQELLTPVEARRLDGLHSLTVALSDVDDYGRVYVNNYLVVDREIGTHVLRQPEIAAEEQKLALKKSILQLGNGGLGPVDVRRFLRVGRNYIVAELENSQYESCSAQLHIEINNVVPLGFPVLLGEGLEAEGGVTLNSAVRKKFESPGSPQFWILFAVCARRIYELDLK
jgi:hypothetical protein